MMGPHSTGDFGESGRRGGWEATAAAAGKIRKDGRPKKTATSLANLHGWTPFSSSSRRAGSAVEAAERSDGALARFLKAVQDRCGASPGMLAWGTGTDRRSVLFML